MEGLLACFSDWVRRAFLLKVAGYTYKEIANRLGKSTDSIRYHLRHAGRQFIAYFELQPGCLARYGLAKDDSGHPYSLQLT
ncbi:MAG: sigma-70 region 4 domain-containing protein [Candidatus Marinimicrobia bacterium]|nr:sigma-70 region 4 domain-containing protein [Candidatus Neomarinimicrobiota bacterium]